MMERVFTTTDRELTETRIVNASRELLWRVWTEPVHVTQWWGPEGFTNTTETMDVREGGEWVHVMHGPDGRNYPNHVRFVEVVKPERIVFDHVTAPHHRSTVTFEDLGDGRTKVTMLLVFATAEERRWTVENFKADVGLVQHMDRMMQYAVNVK